MTHETSYRHFRCAHHAVAVWVVALVASVAPIPVAIAAPLQISSYDVTEMPVSGFGCWSHLYSGTITLTGRTVIGCGNDPPTPIANYTNGSGTLNDGVIGTSYLENQLFTITPFDGGVPFNPAITLHLAEPGIVKHIRIYGGDDPNNATPGSIKSVTVEIEGVAVVFATTPSGGPNYYGVPVNDDIDLSGSLLDGVVTDRIVLRDFVAALTVYGEEVFSITEITVDGDVAFAFAGTPGKANCHGKSVSALAQQFGGMARAASALGFPNVQEVQAAIRAFCKQQ